MKEQGTGWLASNRWPWHLVWLGVGVGVGCTAAAPAWGQSPGIQWIDMEVPRALGFYEGWTGSRVVMESGLEKDTVTVLSRGAMTDEEKADLVERTLLLNGVALIPAGPDLRKAIRVPGLEGEARSEGLEVVTDPKDLPEGDRLVAYVMSLQHLDPVRAVELFSGIFPPHAYGKMVAVPEASAVVMAESSGVIRRYLELQARLDVPGGSSEKVVREFVLERASVDDVLPALENLLSYRTGSRSEGGAEPGSVAGPGGPGEGRTGPRMHGDPRTNKIVMVGEAGDLGYIESLIGYLDAPAAPRVFMERQLDFLRVGELMEHLANLLVPFHREGTGHALVSGGGAEREGIASRGGDFLRSGLGSEGGLRSLVVENALVMGDVTHNRIFISAPREHLETLDGLIGELDRKPRQIQITAVIAQLSLGDELETGLDVIRAVADPGADHNYGGVFRNRTGTLPGAEALARTAEFAGLGSGLTLYGRVGQYLDLYVAALQRTNRLRILSRPTVYTQNDRVAMISTGQRIAVPGTSVSTVDPDSVNRAVTSSISFEDVLLRIEVWPLINSEDQITLRIHQVNDNVTGSRTIGGNEIPTIGTQTLQTTVMVPDGGTVLLGGLISETEREGRSGLPGLVAVPVVGALLGRNEVARERQELLIFLQPRIIDDAVDLRSAPPGEEVLRAYEDAIVPSGFEVPDRGAEEGSRRGGWGERWTGWRHGAR